MSVYFVNAGDESEIRDESQSDAPSPSQSEAQAALAAFWPRITEDIKKITTMDLKQQALPLARIKKIMKLDDEVKMISAEAPMLFAKAAEIFIYELTLRAWVHTEDNKRRTLQRNDIAMAITKYDQFDFLIDIVPRDEIKSTKPREDGTIRTSMNADQVHYYFQLAQQHQQALQQTTPATIGATSGQPAIQIVQPQQIQALTGATTNGSTSGAQQVLLQPTNANTVGQTTPTVSASTSQPQGGIQIVQQIVTPSGEVQQIPLQLSPQQLQMIRMQVQGTGSSQPIIIQTAPIQATNAQPTQLVQVSQQGTSQPVFLSQANPAEETD